MGTMNKDKDCCFFIVSFLVPFDILNYLCLLL